MPRTSKKYNERIEIGRSTDGKRIRVWIRANTKPELEALRREAYAKKPKLLGSIALLGEYAEQWLDTYKGSKSLQTRQMYGNAVNKLDSISQKQIASVTATDLQQIINNYWDHPRTCEVLKLTIRQIFKCAIRDQLVDYAANPSEHLEIPKAKRKETRFISDEEMKQILECKFKEQDRLYVDVLRYTGMRPSEALALMWEDIDFDEKMFHVKRSFEYEGSKTHVKGTKTDTLRDIPLSDSLATALAVVRQTKGYVFRKETDGKPFTKNAYRKLSERILSLITEKIGENDLVMYSFRHTFATFLYYNGCRPGLISTKKAAQIMGHSEKIFLERYTHIDDSKENVADIINKI